MDPGGQPGQGRIQFFLEMTIASLVSEFGAEQRAVVATVTRVMF
jgi:hypothetical protein